MSIIRKAPFGHVVTAFLQSSSCRRGSVRLVFVLALTFALAACDDDESSFVRPGDDSSSSVCEDCDDASSSSVKSNSSSSAKSSSSVKAKSSSSSVAPKSSSSAKSSSSSAKSSPSSLESSSSEAYQHWFPLNGDLKDKYATFVDSRNGREYYYILMEANGKSLKVMAENLNVGEMVWGFKDQKDDSKIERYCYDDDTTKCDRYGALYQWAEMMQLPSECNTKSCADQIKPNHQGICPDGWRLMTADDFKFIINSNGNKDGVKGTRSTFGFGGSNDTGFSLVGAGARNDEGGFEELNETAYWFYLDEYSDVEVLSSVTSAYMDKNPTLRSNKKYGFSVRCVMVE